MSKLLAGYIAATEQDRQRRALAELYKRRDEHDNLETSFRNAADDYDDDLRLFPEVYIGQPGINPPRWVRVLNHPVTCGLMAAAIIYIVFFLAACSL